MASSTQPLVCTSLQLPPDLQPFLRIHEISLQIFLPNFDRLRLALEATQDTNPEATQIFYETRKVTRGELRTLFKVLHAGEMLTERYLLLLEALSEKKPTQHLLYNVNLGAHMGMRCSEEAKQAMATFRGELESAVSRVTTTMNAKSKKGSKAPLTSTENIQSVSEILSAIDECNGLLQQCHDLFAQLATRTQDENSIESDPPSEEETQLMRAKWQTFFDNVGVLWKHGIKIADEILLPSSDGPKNASGRRKLRPNVPLWRTLFQRQDKRDLVRSTNVLGVSSGPAGPEAAVATLPASSHEIRTNVINPLDGTEGLEASQNTAVPNVTPSNGPTSNNSKTPFWRKIFRLTNSDNSTPPPDTTGRLEASDGAPEISVPPPKVTFWRKLSRCAICVSTAPFR